MKFLPVFFLAALTLFSSCSDKSDADTKTSQVNQGKYHNEEYDLTIPIPKDWVVRPNKQANAAPGANEAALEKKRVNRLLFTCLEKNNCNNSLLVVMQPTSAARGGTDPEKHMQYLIDREDEHNRQYQITGHYTKGTEEYGGQKFYTLHVRRQNKNKQFQKLQQVFMFRFIGNEVLNITLNYEEDRYKNALYNALENAEFGK